MKEHFIQEHFHLLFKNYLHAKIKIHQCSDGWIGVLTCNPTGKEYVLRISEIQSEIKVENPLKEKRLVSSEEPLTADKLVSEGGFEDGRD